LNGIVLWDVHDIISTNCRLDIAMRQSSTC
jgi:hypothetical protein